MIHLWDTLSHSVVWSNDVGEQAQSATFSPDGEVIVVGTVTGKWVVLDVNTREVFGVHQDGSEPVFVVKFSPDGNLLALGSRDNAIYMYQVGFIIFGKKNSCIFLTQLEFCAKFVVQFKPFFFLYILFYLTIYYINSTLVN